MGAGASTKIDEAKTAAMEAELGAIKHSAPSLGVIRLDYNYPPAPGDIDHPGSYDFDVYYRVVPGLTFQMCQDNAMTPEVTAEFIEAVKWLDAKGVSGITGDCASTQRGAGISDRDAIFGVARWIARARALWDRRDGLFTRRACAR